MITYNQLKLIGIVVIVLIVITKTQYLKNLTQLYNSLSKIPQVITMLAGILLIFGIKMYNPFEPPTNPDYIYKPQSLTEMNQDNDTELESNLKTKRNVSPETKKLVGGRQGWKCGLCQQPLDETYEIDHIEPLYKGGTNDLINLMALDPICHRKKTRADRLNLQIKYQPKSNPKLDL